MTMKPYSEIVEEAKASAQSSKDSADIVRDVLYRHELGEWDEHTNESALAALDALVAERDEALRNLEECGWEGVRIEAAERLMRAAEARVTELEAALRKIADKRWVAQADFDELCKIARAALANEEKP